MGRGSTSLCLGHGLKYGLSSSSSTKVSFCNISPPSALTLSELVETKSALLIAVFFCYATLLERFLIFIYLVPDKAERLVSGSVCNKCIKDASQSLKLTGLRVIPNVDFKWLMTKTKRSACASLNTLVEEEFNVCIPLPQIRTRYKTTGATYET